MNNRILLMMVICICVFGRLSAQDSLLNSLNNTMKAEQKTGYITGTFKALYIVNMKTIEAPGAGALNFEIQHRFGTVNSGAYNLWGFDFATFRLSLDYGISDRVSIGIGRSTTLKTFDGYVKYKWLRQTDNSGMPVSVSLLGTTDYFTQHYPDKAEQDTITPQYRFEYTAQLLIARKFSEKFSLQLTPTFIHYNLVDTTGDHNNVFALCLGGRMKISKRMAITAEYNYLFPNQLLPFRDEPPRANSLSFGWDIETGGHVFQLVFTNSQAMVEPQYIGNTRGSWGKGYIYFGFNISRNFNLKPHKKA